MVAGAPGPEEAVAAFHLWCGDSVLVAHNTAFDLAFLRQVEPGARCSFDHDVLDTVHLSALCFPHEADHTLDALMDRLGVIWDTADRHTALGDSKMTAECLLRLLPLLKTQGLSSLEDIAAARSGLGQIIRAQAAYERD
jgi:DNA polymerase-3 subunit epsilon